jgi:hypothetical protein
MPSPLLSYSSPLWTTASFKLKYSCCRLPYRTDLVAPVVIFITPRHGPKRKHRLQQYLYCCASICCCGNVFTKTLPRNGSTRYNSIIWRHHVELGLLKTSQFYAVRAGPRAGKLSQCSDWVTGWTTEELSSIPFQDGDFFLHHRTDPGSHLVSSQIGIGRSFSGVKTAETWT